MKSSNRKIITSHNMLKGIKINSIEDISQILNGVSSVSIGTIVDSESEENMFSCYQLTDWLLELSVKKVCKSNATFHFGNKNRLKCFKNNDIIISISEGNIQLENISDKTFNQLETIKKLICTDELKTINN